ncbi:MAG: alpha/beta hydrolase, partial [Eubacteriales bacterium]
MEVRNIVYDETIGEAGKLDLYLPDGIENCPVLVYFHGGGLEGGDKCDMLPFFRELQKNGIAVVSANYRMYPCAKFPEFILDCASVVSWVKNKSHRYACFGEIFVGGSSAGAYLAMMLFFDKYYLGEHGIDPNELAGYLFDAGQPTVHFNVLRERGLDNRLVRIDEAAPLYFIEHEYENPQSLPTILIFVADNDMANRLEQN